MSRRYPKSSGRGKSSSAGGKRRRPPRKIAQQAEAEAREVQLPLDVASLVAMARESLSSFAVEMGLKGAQCLLEDEVTRRCGARHERRPDRRETRFGHQRGFITIAGQKVSVAKPRVRSTHGAGEGELEVYGLLQSPEALPQAALDHLVNGVSTRRYEQVVQAARAGFGVKKSSVSRGFVRASAAEVERLAERRFDDERFAVIFIDAQPYAGEMMVTALGITPAGEKRLLGLRQGATENAIVVASLLEELRERGVRTDLPTLFVLDGAKALSAAVNRVWGKFAVIQRCQVHKRRNVAAHLAEERHEELGRRLAKAYHEANHAQALALLKATVKWLRTISPAAAASLEEGLEETVAVVRLGVPELLRKTLATTNPIESAFSVAESVTRRVKRWRDGDMRQRWCVAGLRDAESRFHRVKGHKHMPQFLKALERLVAPTTLDAQRKQA
ncbi:MAG: IS256 family transposase [Pirellulales bacterium]|nr:IS256 family transposase [Pirellulales bacterium]